MFLHSTWEWVRKYNQYVGSAPFETSYLDIAPQVWKPNLDAGCFIYNFPTLPERGHWATYIELCNHRIIEKCPTRSGHSRASRKICVEFKINAQVAVSSPFTSFKVSCKIPLTKSC